MTVLACFLAVACSGGVSTVSGPEGDDGGGTASVSTVQMTPSDLAVGVDGTANLSLEIRTADGEPLDRDGEWTVDDPSVVEVEGKGTQRQVKGIAEGRTLVIGTVDGVADTADVEVSPDAPTVSSVELSPSDVTIEEGGTVELSLTVTTSDGSSLEREGSWEIEAPSVAGLNGVGATRQVEGLSAGSTRVFATVEGVTETAAVEVISSSSGEVQPVFEDGFESGDVSHSEGGWSWGVGDGVVGAGSGRSGSAGMEITHPAKADGDDSKANQNLLGPGSAEATREIWVEYWMKVPSNFNHRDQSAGATNNKYFQIWGGGTRRAEPKAILEYQRVDPAGSGDRHESYIRDGEGGEDWNNRIADPGAAPYIQASDHGTWVRVRWHFRIGDHGSANSVVRLWKNGTLRHEDTSYDDLANSDPSKNYFDHIRFLGWANSGFDEETTFVFDDVKIYTQDPGW